MKKSKPICFMIGKYRKGEGFEIQLAVSSKGTYLLDKESIRFISKDIEKGEDHDELV